MKNIILINCLIFNYLIINARELPEDKGEESGGYYSAATYQFNNPGVKYIYPEWGFYVEESTGFSLFENKNLSSEIWNVKAGLGFNFNAGYFRSLNPRFRIKTGLGFSYLSGKLEGNGDAPLQELPDIDGELYTETLTLNHSENIANLLYLSAPFVFEFGNVNITRTGYYIDAGLKYSFLLMDKYKTDGSYSTKGYYEKWGVTLENIDELGFYSDKPLESNAEFKSSDLSIVGGFGISVPVSASVILKFGITGNFGLLDIGNNASSANENPSITMETQKFRSEYIDNMLAVKKETKTRYIGLELGLYFNSRVK